MTGKKPNRSVSGMNVLGDIRGLLSVNREPGAGDAEREKKFEQGADATALKEEIERYKVLVEKQEKEMEKLKNESAALAERHRAEIIRLENENRALLQKKTAEGKKPKGEDPAQVQKLRDEIKRLKSDNELGLRDRLEIESLRQENRELLARLEPIRPPVSGTPDIETARLEANKAELTLALEQVEGLLQLRSKELMNRLARVFQEASQGEIALEFRRGRDQLESLENLAHFVQALLDE